MPPGWGGGPVVVRGRESRPHGEGIQRVRSPVLECQEVAGEHRRSVADLDEAEPRVLAMQTKLHQWATDDPGRRFDDLFNLVYDPAFLVVAWDRVRGNKGARTAGVDGVEPRSIGRRWSGSCRGCEMISRPAGSSRCRCGERTDPQSERQAPLAGDPDRPGPGRASRVEAGARADLRGGLPAVSPTASARSAEPRTPSPRSTTSDHQLVRVGVRGGHHGVLRRDRPHRPSWAGCEIGSGTSVSWAGEGVPAGRGPHRGRRHHEDTSPAPRKAGSSRRCWPTSPCRSSTSTSPRWAALGRLAQTPTAPAQGPGHLTARPLRGRLRGHGRRHPRRRRSAAGTRWQRCSRRWACACRRRRRGSATSTRGSTSSAGASSADSGEGRRTRRSSTPTRRRRRLPRSWTRCGRSPDRARTSRSPTCCAGSTRCCGAGATTSATACPQRTFSYLDHFAFWRVVGWLAQAPPG